MTCHHPRIVDYRDSVVTIAVIIRASVRCVRARIEQSLKRVARSSWVDLVASDWDRPEADLRRRAVDDRCSSLSGRLRPFVQSI